MKRYMVLQYEDDIRKLVNEVEIFMNLGWIPVGGISAFTYNTGVNGHIVYLQAMTKDANESGTA